MATITTRAGKGSPLTNTEVDANFTNINSELGQKLTGNQTVTLSGDATGSGATAIAVTLANSGVTAGSYGSSSAIPVITVDAKGRLSNVSTAAVSIPSGSLTFTGDVTGSGNTGSSTALTLANSGATAGTYTKVTVDAKGRVTTGSSLASSDVTTALGFTPYNSSNPSGYITSSSLSSYLPLTGGTLTGQLNIDTGTNLSFGSQTRQMINLWGTQYGIGVQSGTTYFRSASRFSWHRGGSHNDSENNAGGGTVAMTLDSGNSLYVTGNVFNAGNQVLHAGNYTSYSPSLTGSGASGTWGINISGNANTASLAIWSNQYNFTTAGAGWYRVATTGSDGRGTYNVELFCTGGSHNPSLLQICAQGDWGNDKIVYAKWDGNFPANAVRITRGASNTFLEVYFTTTILGATFRINRTGFDTSITPFTGSLPAGGDTVKDTLDITAKINASTLSVSNSTTAIRLASGYHIGMGDWGMRNTTPYGWIQFGPANSSWAHIYADRTFYFNQELYVNNQQVLHSGNYSNYSLPLSGGTLTGSATISGNGNGLYFTGGNNRLYFSGYRAMEGSTNGAQLQIGESYSATYLQSANNYATTSNHVILHAGNYTSTLDGRYLYATSNPSVAGNFTLSIGNNGSYSYVQSHAGQPLELNPVGNTVRIAGNIALHAGNFGSYALPLSGGTLTGGLNGTTGGFTGFFGIGGSFGSDDGGWGARLNVGGGPHARIDARCANDGIVTTIYSHVGQNRGFVGTLSNHRLCLGVNGSEIQSVHSSYSESVGSYRAPIFYDSGNTSYYADPAGNSVLYKFESINQRTAYDRGWSNYPSITVYNTTDQGPQGEFRIHGAPGANGGDFSVDLRVDGSIITHGISYGLASSRAPIFYDYDDTGYYIDPNSTSDAALRMRGGALFGPNITWGASLYVGGNGRVGSSASVAVTNGNLHLDCQNGYNTYINWYAGTNTYTQGNFGVGSDSASHRLHVHGTGFATSDFRSPIFYDSNNTAYYADPDGTSSFNQLRSNYLANRHDVSTDHGFGIYFEPGLSTAYAIFRESGSWSHPYPDLRIAFHTGIKLGAHASYQGIRFYDDYNMAGQVMSVNNGSDPLGGGNVYVNNSLQAGSSLRAPIFYDSNDTGFYIDQNSESNWQGLTLRGKAQTGLTGKSNWKRPDITGDSNYWTGIMGWGTTDFNTVMTWGSGFFDTWSSPANSPGDTSHWTGVQSYHYVSGANSGYGWQLAGGPTDSLWWRHSWPHNSSWFKVAMYGNNHSTGSFYASIFYDANDTAYYGNFADSGNSIVMAGSVNAQTYNKPALRVNSSGSSSSGAAFAIQQITAEGWTGVFVDYEPYTGWGLYHDNPNNYFCVTSEGATGGIRSFTVPSRESGNRTAYEKIRFDQNDGSIIAGGNVTAYSDIRVKENVQVVTLPIQKVMAMRGVTFTRNDEQSGRRYVGVIAQEVEKVLPEVVFLSDESDKDSSKTVAYGNIVGLLIEAIKEQQLQIAAVSAEINSLKERLQ